MQLDRGAETGVVRGGMFVRLKTIRSSGRTDRHLHLVENRGQSGKVRRRSGARAKDHRPDHLQLVLGVVLRRDREGILEKLEARLRQGGVQKLIQNRGYRRFLEVARVRDLSQVRAVTVRLAGERYRMRTPLQGHTGKIFAAVGVNVPPLVQAL